jgi:hypothetical protein
MKWFDVNWIQHHGVKIRALDKQEAKDIALGLSDLEALQLISGTTVKEVK